MNPRLKTLLNLWPQIVTGYHKSCDHYWRFSGEYNVLSEETSWWLIHDGYCHKELEYGPFQSLEHLLEWDGEDLRQKMLDICRYEMEFCEGGKYLLAGDDTEMSKQHWQKLIEKLENL